jgi:hypothetical protein
MGIISNMFANFVYETITIKYQFGRFIDGYYSKSNSILVRRMIWRGGVE